jgi:hypothetical protein
VDAAQVLFNGPGAIKQAGGEYLQGQGEAALKGVANAMAEGRDPTEDFDLVEHITNEITGGE